MADTDKVLSTLRRLTSELRESRGRLREAEASAHEKIAIVGMGCRFPGGITDPDGLWRLLRAGQDAITELPTDRGWDGEFSGSAAFLTDPGWFDAAFFGIGAREALTMDPQQRLLLEICWEALERSGIEPTSLRGSRTGAFIGTNSQDYHLLYGDLLAGRTGIEHLATAAAASVLSGRVNYFLGLQGPAVSIDTACSSSLVAMHGAIRSLRTRECDLALAGGITVMATPWLFTVFEHQGALAPDGRCKAFAEAADGVGWGEGAGVVVLERLSDALASGHPVLAVVSGSAVNSDGSSNGLTAPNGLAQQRVIREALADAGASHHDVDLIEAHGTGTRLGDPIEASALLGAYGRDRQSPLALGSVKSNLGHTQAAAGIAGVIKTVLALRHRVMPKTLHVDRPSSQVDWGSGGLEPLTEERAWPATDGRVRRAGVSSFGISGTNAHLILEEGPAPETPGELGAQAPVLPWVLSARTESALRARAEQLLGHLDGRDPAGVSHALVTTRAMFEQRAVVLDEQPRSGLAALSRGRSVSGLVTGSADLRGKVVFVFPGQGGQWAGMAADLLDSSPVFARHIDRCASALKPHLDWDLVAVLRGDPGAPPLERVDVVQPALFALMVSLAALWRDSGIEPDAVVGHSQGEIAAAHVAGALSLPDAAMLVARRSAALATLAGRGAMASVELPPDQIAPRLGDQLSIATVNGPGSVVVAGEPEALRMLVARLERAGVRTRTLAVDYASHSPQVELIREQLLDQLAPLSPRASDIPIHSSVTGEVVNGSELTARYWYRNLRQPVRFDQAIAGLSTPDHGFFVEVSPHPVLVAGMLDTLGDKAAVVGTLRRGENGRRAFLASLAELFVRGLEPRWTAWAAPTPPPFTELPTYPFERARYWLAPPRPGRSADHPVLGRPVELAATDELVLTGEVSIASMPWLADHKVLDQVVFPGTGWLECAVHAGALAGLGTVEELTLEVPLVVPDDAEVAIQLRVGAPENAGRRRLALHARSGAGRWIRHGTGVLGPARPSAGTPDAWPPPDAEEVPLTGLYSRLVERGLRYGPAFQGLRRLWRRADELFAEVSGPEDTEGFTVHPAALDAALHSLGFGPGHPDTDGPLLPFAWTGVCTHARTGPAPATLRVRLSGSISERVRLEVTDGQSVPVLSVESLVLRPAPTPRGAPRDALYKSRWIEVRGAGVATAPSIVALGFDGGDFVSYPDTGALIDAVRAGTPAPSAVLVSGGGGPVRQSLHRALELVQWWSGSAELATSRLVFVTRGAVATRAGEDVTDLAGAAVHGLLRSAQAEEPYRFVLLDLDRVSAQTVTAALSRGEPEMAVRGGRILARRLVGVAPVEAAGVAGPDDTVLITGGTGTLGGLVAGHLVTAHGVRRLVLLSRTGRAPKLAGELAGLGAEVTAVAADVTDRAQLTAVLAAHRPTLIVHAAGVLDDGVISAMTPDRVDAVLAPKAEAAVLLHELTRELPLTAFVLFSSAAATVGSAGQSNYAAANALLDGLAHHRHAQGLPAVSLAWGLWEQRSDMTRHLDAAPTALSTPDALALFDAALAREDPVLVPAQLDLRASTSPLLRELGPASDEPADDLRALLELLSPQQREQALLDVVLTSTAAALGHEDAQQLRPRTEFLAMGVDSLAAVRIRNDLADRLDVRLPATVVFDHPSPVELVRHLAAVVADPGAQPAEEDGSGGPTLRELRLKELSESGGMTTRPMIHSLDELPEIPRLVRLAAGDRSPALICVASFVGKSDPVQYARLARSFRGERDVWALRQPGFRRAEPLPATADVWLDIHAATLRAGMADTPFVLTGLSSGGLAAYAIAERLTELGVPPMGVAMLDTYGPDDEAVIVKLARGLEGEFSRRMNDPNFAMPGDDGWVTAMLHYERFGYTPAPLALPVLFLRAGSPLPGWPPDWKPTWPHQHTEGTTLGNHFTMLEDHADDTAARLRDWIDTVAAQRCAARSS